jgi:hypothetical protein
MDGIEHFLFYLSIQDKIGQVVLVVLDARMGDRRGHHLHQLSKHCLPLAELKLASMYTFQLINVQLTLSVYRNDIFTLFHGIVTGEVQNGFILLHEQVAEGQLIGPLRSIIQPVL